jgi:hypothetical protein
VCDHENLVNEEAIARDWAAAPCKKKIDLIFKVIKYSKKGEVVSIQALKAYVGTRSIGSLILNLGNSWRSAVSLRPWQIFLLGTNSSTYLTGGRVGSRPV